MPYPSAGLGEFRIRDLNDEINKLLREKRHWEDRIKELGGPDYGVRRKIKNQFVSSLVTSWLFLLFFIFFVFFFCFLFPNINSLFSRKLVQRCWIMKAKRFPEIEDTSMWNNDANLRSCMYAAVYYTVL